MGRPPCCDKLNVKRGPWTAEEDAKILAYVSNHGVGNWTLVPKRAGLNRCGKSCRLRWTNYLRPDLKHDGFTPQEEDHIINLHKVFGSRWSLIAKQLPGRTDNDVKNYWNTKLKKKLSKMGIDPVTHKPFSQILSEFGNISGIQHIGASNPTTMSKPEPACSVLTGLDSSYSKMVRSPVMEQVNDNISISNNPCWDFVTGFHLNNPNNVQSHFFGEATSSCSSPSTTAFSQFTPPQSFSHRPPPEAVHIPLNPSFTWNEFLLSDPAPFMDPPQQQQEHTPSGTLLSSNLSTLTPNELSQCFNRVGFGGSGVDDCGAASGYRVNNHADSTSSSASSFVDAILDHDRELCSQFPELLDGSFDY